MLWKITVSGPLGLPYTSERFPAPAAPSGFVDKVQNRYIRQNLQLAKSKFHSRWSKALTRRPGKEAPDADGTGGAGGTRAWTGGAYLSRAWHSDQPVQKTRTASSTGRNGKRPKKSTKRSTKLSRNFRGTGSCTGRGIYMNPLPGSSS